MFLFLNIIGYKARHIIAIWGHANEASIRSYSSNISEDQTRRMSESSTLARIDKGQSAGSVVVRNNSTPVASILGDCDLLSTLRLSQLMNTVVSPIMSKDKFKNNKFEECTINIIIQRH